jgi:signal transduction histidine kinase
VAVEQGRLLIPGVEVGIGLRSPGSPGRMHYVASSVPELQPLAGRDIAVAEDGLGWTARTTGRPVESTVAGTSYERLRRAGINMVRLLPLLTGVGTVAEPEPMGLLGFFRRGDVPFTDSERRLMDEFAKRVSLALHRAQLLDTANRMARRLQVGVETAIDLGSVPDRGLVIHRLVQRACGAVDADRCTLGRIEGDRFVTDDSFDVEGFPTGIGDEWRIADHEALLAALLQQRPARQHGFDPAAATPEMARAFAGVRHTAAAPLVLQSRVEAMLVVSRRREPAFDEDDLATLWQLTSIAVLTLRSASLLEEARAADLAKSRFMNMAAHELRTPLAAINGYVSMLADGTFGPLDAPLRGPVEILTAKTAELAMLIEDILTASRLETGQLRAVPKRVDAGQVAARATARARTRLDLRAGRLHERRPAEPVWAQADPQHVERVLGLLIDNAIKYAGGPPDVTVSVTRESDVVLRVADAGIGIDPALHELVFERFYRIDDPAAGWFPPGAGLGLAICRELAGLMGGSVVLERSAAGEGSVFALRLPAAD